MTMKSPLDPYATEVLKPVVPATEKRNAVPQATEKLNPVLPNSPVPAIPAQRQDSLPAAHPVARSAQSFAPAPDAPHRARWEHLPAERHPHQAERQPHQPERHPHQAEEHPQSRLRAAQLLVQRTTDLRAVAKPDADPRSSGADRQSTALKQAGSGPRAVPERGAVLKQQAVSQKQAVSRKQAAPTEPAAPRQRWQRSAVAVAPAQGTLAAAGFAACDYLIRTVSVLGLLAVVGMVTAGTAQTQAPDPGRTPSTTVATAPAHPGSSTSTHHRG